MDRVGAHPCWWKEIRAIRKLDIESSLKRYIVMEDLNEPKALDFSHWQAAAFRLPLAQQEASSWWDAPPYFCGLHPYDFLPHTDASGTRGFWIVRQEKSLALA